MPQLDRPRLYVDFNEMLDTDLFLLSRDDHKVDSSGNTVTLTEGLRVYVYSDDGDDAGAPTYLIATGIAERNRATDDWNAHVRWCCRIDAWHR